MNAPRSPYTAPKALILTSPRLRAERARIWAGLATVFACVAAFGWAGAHLELQLHRSSHTCTLEVAHE